MISGNVSLQRTFTKSILWLLFAISLALAAIFSAQTENARATTGPISRISKGYCASTLDQAIVYFSNIFDANIKAQTKISTQPLNFAFKNYLIEKYDFKSSSNFPANCALFETLSQAEANKRQLEVQARQATKQVVEVNWNPGPLAEVPQGDESVAVGPAGPPPTHTFCAVGHESTMYFSAVFDTAGALVNSKWNDAFNEFLNKRYGFRAEVEATCTILNTVREAEQNLNARVAGARAGSRKAVETGWKFDPTGIYNPVPKPAPKADDDPEAPIAQKQPQPAPSGNIGDFATKEVPVALAYCQNDRIMSGAFDCDCVQRNVYNYRMKQAEVHPGSQPEPLASLLAGEKLDCSSCIGQWVQMWAKSAAQSRGLVPNAADCAAQRFMTSLKAKPYLSHVKEFFDGAVAACKK
jgi:hypothetical protein